MSYTAALQHTGPLLCCRSHAELFPLQQWLLCLIRFQLYLPAPYDSITSAARQHAQMHSTREQHKSVISLSLSLSPTHLLSLSLCYSPFLSKHLHPLIHTFIYSQPHTHNTHPPTNKCAHINKHTNLWLFLQHLSSPILSCLRLALKYCIHTLIPVCSQITLALHQHCGSNVFARMTAPKRLLRASLSNDTKSNPLSARSFVQSGSFYRSKSWEV